MEIYFINMIKVSILVGIIILLVAIITPITMKKYSNRWRYWLWPVLGIMLLIPLNLNIANAPINIVKNDIQAIAKNEIVDTTNNEEVPAEYTTEKTVLSIDYNLVKRNSTISFRSLFNMTTLIYVWLIGAMLFLLINLLLYFSYKRKIVRWSLAPINEEIINLFNKAKHNLNINADVRLKISDRVNSPMLIGIRKPIIVFPNKDFTLKELDFILNHELTHLTRKDILYKLFLLIVKSIHWFNPMMYLMNKLAAEDIELYCDYLVTKDYTETRKHEYTRTIINVIKLQKNSSIILSTNFKGGKKTMKKRIKTLVNNKKQKKGSVVFISIILVAFMLQGLVACSNEKIEPIVAEGGNQPSIPAVTEKNVLPEESVVPIEGDIKSVVDESMVTALKENEDYDFTAIEFIASEKVKNVELENALVRDHFASYEKVEDYPELRYLYNKVDLNDDGVDEYFVILISQYFSGSGGSTANIYQLENGEYTLVSNMTLANVPIIISDDMTNGWKDIIMYVSGGGATPAYTVLKYDGEKYPLNPSMQPELENGSIVNGVGILTNEINVKAGFKY